MKLYVIRHGHTPCNETGTYNGNLDEDLDSQGIRQALEARRQLAEVEFDVIYCSPLLRTRHTCELLNEKNRPVIYDDRLKERTLGVLDGTNLSSIGVTIKQHLNYYYRYHVEGAEEFPDVFRRVQSFLDELKTTYTDETILIVSHGGLIRVLHYCMNEIPEDGDLSGFQTENCQIRQYEL